MPARTCLNMAGPFDVSLMAAATTSITGESTMAAARDTVRSNALLSTLYAMGIPSQFILLMG